MSEDTKLDLAPIKARCAAATREPWKASCAPGAASVRSEWANCAIYINVRQNGETPECVTRWHRDAEFTAHARTDVPALVAEVERLTAQKDNAYNERDRCVSVIACLARALGWPVWLGTHEGDPWDEEWRNIVFVETPHGQVSWHYHDSERPMFSWIGLGMPTPKPWDGHSTPEKYNLLFGLVHDGIPNVQAEVARLRSELAECYRITGADPDGDDDAMLATKAVDAVKRLRASADHEGEKSEEWEQCYRALEAEIVRLRAIEAEAKTYLANMDYCFTAENLTVEDEGHRDASESRLRALLAKGGA